ncbi:MAG: acetate--CoA ligase [Bacteroidia bacterium]|nr:acetate--CoA ligase [Bacteroidia bacterium]
MRIRTWDDYLKHYASSEKDPEQFWSTIARNYQWKKEWRKVLEWEFKTPSVKWFIDGKLNITENCLDRHLASHADKIAFYWEPNHPDKPGKTITYKQLYHEVCRTANALKELGIKKGDRVCIYLPMIPEAVISMLACVRIGAIHSVVFAGFSALSLSDRIKDAGCKLLITSDGAYRGDKNIPLKEIAEEALKSCSEIEKVLLVRYTGQACPFQPGRDVEWDSIVPGQIADCPAEEMDSEDYLFILYTSGSTGKPKGVVHSCGGYMVYAGYSFLNVFQYDPGDIFWCTADVGWVTGHSYIVYGPLLNGATSVMFEGVPTWPSPSRFWQVVEKYKVTHFYTAPTAIRALEAAGNQYVEPYEMKSLKVLGSVGEPINEEAWQWYHEKVGKKRCPIADTWWQTETGGILISPLAGITKEKPSYATYPLPGVFPVLVDDKGNILEGNNVEGNLCIRFPWPSIIRTTFGNHERCRQAYFETYPGLYFTGDGCRRDEEGRYRITGRVDDVINVSGHRLGTAEIENAINEHPDVVESAVVGYPHEIKGQGIYAYVIAPHTKKDADTLKKEIIATVNKIIGPIAKPDKIQLVSGLPKTRSGKIMRRILRKIAEGELNNLGDTTTLLDPAVVEEIKMGRL